MELLSVNCVADLKGCTVRNIQYQIKHGQIPCKEVRNDKNRPQFLVPLDALDPRLQERYYKQKRGEVLSTAAAPARPVPAKPLDAYSETERSEIDFWIETVNRWQTYRNKPDVKNKAAVDERFVTLMQLENDNLNISIDILYRKWAALRSGNYDGLVDKRGKWKKGRSETPQDIFDVFETYFLDESQHPIERCIEYTQLYLQEKKPELVDKIPSYSTFHRRTKEIPYPVFVLGRFGEKAYYDLCSAYVRRQYENISSNEWWVADTHTFDILSRGENGKTHRIYINAYMDARSGIFTGWYITDNPSSDASLYALRRAIMAYGIPTNIYVDTMNSFIGWIGGKRLLRNEILSRFPKDNIERYIEVCGGAGWVMFAKPKTPKQLEVFNDADGDLINLYRCVKYHCNALQEELDWILSSREQFYDFAEQLHTRGLTDIQRAARYFYLIKISFGSDRNTFATASKSIDNAKEYLAQVQKRLKGVVIEHRDCVDLIKIYDRPNALFYIDPPYVGTEKYYEGSFGLEDHKRLANTLRCVKGRFVLSYGDDPLIWELYDGYNIERISRNNTLAAHSTNTEPFKEVIVTNF